MERLVEQKRHAAAPECLILAVRDRLLAGEFLQHLVLRGERLPGEWLAMTVIAVGYLFLRFCRLRLRGPLTASSMASFARRLIMGFLFGGKASGWPIFQSVLFLFDPEALFFALFAMPLEWHR